jgi:sterol desaturase/sphingolipid hydroxylase (fatty acid hydroxylase superfamily)
LVVATFFVPVHIGFVLSLEIFVAFWTIYIHTDVMPLPWPMMGCDYHYLHHKYNWYNFGFMTVFWDTAWCSFCSMDSVVLGRASPVMANI